MSKQQTAYLLAHTYWDRQGQRPLFSGVQRYIRELTKVFIAAGVSPVVFQKADRDFEIQHGEVKIIGLQAGKTAWADPWFNYRAHRRIPPAAPVVYCVLELANPIVRKNSIAIQHGIWWNGAYARWKFPLIRAINRRVIRNCRAVLCVDTNYINWCLSVLPEPQLLLSKCHYIPNFVDPEEFPPSSPSPRRDGDPPVVLFPRRCAIERGALLFWEACLRLWDAGQRFQAVYCGFGPLQEQIRQAASARGYAGYVQIREAAFEEMAEVYRGADIVVIPSLWCEGTSLSCIEAMHMGKPVVATFVGGLPNLILPGYNGELVSPQPDALANALHKLLVSPELRAQYAQRAREISGFLSVGRWRAVVRNLIASRLLDPAPPTVSPGETSPP